jgi:hypothetical protein
MTNYELNLEFIKIASKNPFDAYLDLKKMNKIYKQSEFYKETKMSIDKAYKLFLSMSPAQLVAKLQEFTDIELLSAKLTDVLNGIDEESVNNLLNKLTGIFDIEKLQDEKGELKLLLNQIKNLVE